MTKSSRPSSPAADTGRSRAAGLLAAGLAAGLAAAGLLVSAAQPAGAAARPRAQSVGNFLDADLNGTPIDQVATLQYATARAPGRTSAQNPLDVTALDAINLPLSGALQLPGGNAVKLGAAQQLAVARTDGYAYGAAGAVRNSGGVALGGDNSAYPSGAAIDLGAAALSSLGGSSLPIPALPSIPGLPTGGVGSTATSLAALGGLTASVSGVWSIAQTESGGRVVTPKYGIGSVRLQLGSPALGRLLQTLAAGGTTLTGLLSQASSALGALSGSVPGLPAARSDCAITAGSLPSTIELDRDSYDPSQGAAVSIDAKTATVTVNVNALLDVLLQHGNAINGLPANTDLTDYLVANLPKILSTGLEGVVNGVTDPLSALGQKCLGALGQLSGVASTVLDALSAGQQQLESAVTSVAGELSSTGASGLGALTAGLKQLIDIGVNVESGPGRAADNTAYPFTSRLAATPKQGTPVVSGQSLVRAVELQLVGDPLADVGLANSAAGPGTGAAAAAPATSSGQAGAAAAAALPTGVPAGFDKQPGSPALPIILLSLGLGAATVGGLAWRLRGTRLR